MLPERYEYKKSRSLKQYDFYSEGPKGKIKKTILYSYIDLWNGYPLYNLGFGDYDQQGKTILDLVVSDNKDADKVLATVAATAVDFTNHYPDCGILVEGSTLSRTRLYQIKIVQHYYEISKLFDLQGLTKEGSWVSFKGGENYRAFFIRRK